MSADADTIREAQRLVAEQAEDEGLWFIAELVTEGYFQQELRRLHAAVEAIPLARLQAQAQRAQRAEEALRLIAEIQDSDMSIEAKLGAADFHARTALTATPEEER